MAKSRLQYASQDALSSSPRLREGEVPSRWTEYLNVEMTSPVEGAVQSSAGSHKGLNVQFAYELILVAEGLMAKMYRLNQILDYPDSAGHVFSEAFWKAGLFPNHPKICILLSKKFPEHHSRLQLERVDKIALDSLNDHAEVHLQSLEPWVLLLEDLMLFREKALRLMLDLSSTVITLLIPRKMLLQMYNLLHAMLRNDRDCDFYHRDLDVDAILISSVRLVQFIDSYDPPLKGLHEDLNFVSPRIGEVLEAVSPIIFLSADTRKLRNEGFLSPFHPRYPEILTNSAHPMRAEDLLNVTSYREWVLFGYLVCPGELLRVSSIDIALVVLKEHIVLTLFRDEVSFNGYPYKCAWSWFTILRLVDVQYISLHEDYQLYVLPRILESKKLAKSGRTRQKEGDMEYSVAKQVAKMIREVHDQALLSCDTIHRERRTLLKQEIGRMVLFFTDQPSLLAPNIQGPNSFLLSMICCKRCHGGCAVCDAPLAIMADLEFMGRRNGTMFRSINMYLVRDPRPSSSCGGSRWSRLLRHKTDSMKKRLLRGKYHNVMVKGFLAFKKPCGAISKHDKTGKLEIDAIDIPSQCVLHWKNVLPEMVFSALGLAQSEVLWYFQHVGISSSKSKATRISPANIDPTDPTIGFLLDGMDRLCSLVRKYIAGY
ncbi:hypothetical protein RJ639_017589 [Escallonia herrerae]|uniref:Uncharacterized protein n=1 Tax=Escallonia herrerae TaxID=1293975 RepID=A0AA88VI38_9ASTE|nr:hypothetical protein RJ639_017589 [Escallonia herrerae]